ncbi:MAG: penicillin acylase family protein [Sandaracinaceae bacterium]|nr:penicillin acylase family protein [Sandaracinaceae bacterium]
MLRRAASSLLLALSLVACDGDPPPADGGGLDAGPTDPPPPSELAAIDETARHVIGGLAGHAHVVRTEHDVPHIYADNRIDAWRVLGFTMARDRFFQMDLTARLSMGRLSELFGDAALGTDIENRQTGAAHMAQLYLDGMSAEEAAELDAFAEGVNAYIAAVGRRELPPPKELEIGFGLLGARRPADLMRPWTRETVAATGATVLYGTSFESGDPRRAAAMERIGSAFEGMPDADLRRAGLMRDIVERVAPPRSTSSAAGWGIDTAGRTSAPIVDPTPRRRPAVLGGPRVERGMLDRLVRRLDHLDAIRHPNGHEGWGSNEWAVMGSATTDGRALLAGDGHLQLSVPALFWQFGLDTVLMGDGSDDVRLMGATIAALPMMGVGTNGHVAWTQTAFFPDVTDWYAEELTLDAEGMPRASRFRGEERPLVRVDEVFEIANVPALGSVGRTETLPRFITFDGRFITSIEGRRVSADEPLGPGESRVNLMGDWVVPEDVDGDGVIGAVSFYYGPFDGGTLMRAFRGFADARTVEDYRQAMRHFIGYGGSMMAADSSGSILYSGYHSVPCRTYLPRDPTTNAWIAGADPRRLLDGTQYGAWRIPLDARGRVDEAAAAAGGPTACAVPFDEWPQAINPARQYVQHANNDPGNITTDNDLFDDPHYIGGPWIEGYRAARIDARLSRAIAANTASIAEMQAIQGDHHSNLGEEWVPYLLEFVSAARDAAAGSPPAGTPEARMAALFTANRARFEEVERRMRDWRDADYPTPAGVDTFYHAASAAEREHSVATMLFAAWFPRFVQGTLDDEGIDRNWSPAVTGDTYTMQTMLLLITGRGPGNPSDLGSWSPATQESVFFDDVRTAQVESSAEIGLVALAAALEFLAGEPTRPGEGGFGTADMSEWRWGLRHQVRFESLLADFLGSDPSLGVLLDMFAIDTTRLRLAPDLAEGDPRRGLRWFPRPGDQFDVDAANPGLSGVRFTHGSGPVFRMVIALGPDGVEGHNMLPGGQSGNPDSPFFDDQAAEWLGNRTVPMRFTPAEVVAGAVGRERYAPE